MIPLIITLFCCALFLAQLVFILAACQTAKRFPITERKALAVPGCSETLSAPKGLGSLGYKPLMRNPRAPREGLDDRDTAGNIFQRECTPALGRILKIQIAQTLAGNGSQPRSAQ